MLLESSKFDFNSYRKKKKDSNEQVLADNVKLQEENRDLREALKVRAGF